MPYGSTWDDPNRITSTRLHGIWFIREHRDDAFIWKIEYRYCYDELAQTPSYWVTVYLTDRHPDSPNIYVNDRANMLWLDIFWQVRTTTLSLMLLSVQTAAVCETASTILDYITD